MKLIRPIVWFDLESTGLSLTEDRIIEISMFKIYPENNKSETYYKRINPQGKSIGEEAFSKHQIKLEDLNDCPTFNEVAKEIYDFINDCDLGGYNCKRFDVPLLIEEFLRAKIYINVKSFNIVDVYKILNKCEPRTLEGTYKRFFGKTFDGAHNAESDIKATIEIFDKMQSLEQFGLNFESTAKELDNFAFADDNILDLENKLKFNKNNEITFNFGKYSGKTIQEVYLLDKGYFDWIIQKSDMTQYTKIIFSNILKMLNK